MDFQSRFAIFTAVGIASFSAGLSLTTACSQHTDAEPEKIVARPAQANDTKPLPPPTPAAIRPSELSLAAKPNEKANVAKSGASEKTNAIDSALAPQVAARIGTSLYPKDAEDLDTLLRIAQAEQGGN